MVFKNELTVAVVILNWNGRRFLEQFLPTVLAYSADYQIIVADNASTDDSVFFLRQHFPQVHLIILDQNYGFCTGYNRALQQVEAKYYVLLNSDVEVTPQWLTPVLTLMQSDESIAACQPKIKSFHKRNYFEYAGAGGGFIDYLGYPFCQGRIFDQLEKDISQYNNSRQVFWATGACLVVRARVYKELEGLEPAFFAHMEEIDLCWRMQKAGYKIMYCGQSEVYHVGGGTLPKDNPRKTFLNFRNGLAMLYKNTGANNLLKIISLRLLLDWIAALKFLTDGNLMDAFAVLKAHKAVWENRRYWKSQRRKSSDKYLISDNLIYPRSIVWDFFIKGRKTFRELEIPDSAALPANTLTDVHPESQHQINN